jgi:hypothetical protein
VLNTVDTPSGAQVVEHDAAEALLNAWSDRQGRIAPEAMSTWSWFEHVDAFILGWVEGGEIRQDKCSLAMTGSTSPTARCRSRSTRSCEPSPCYPPRLKRGRAQRNAQ